MRIFLVTQNKERQRKRDDGIEGGCLMKKNVCVIQI